MDDRIIKLINTHSDDAELGKLVRQLYYYDTCHRDLIFKQIEM